MDKSDDLGKNIVLITERDPNAPSGEVKRYNIGC